MDIEFGESQITIREIFYQFLSSSEQWEGLSGFALDDVMWFHVMCLVGWWVGGGEWDELSLILMMKCSSLKCFVPFSTLYKTQREDEIIDLIARKHPEFWILHFHSAPHTQNTSRHAWDELHLNSRCSVTQQFWQFSPKKHKTFISPFRLNTGKSKHILHILMSADSRPTIGNWTANLKSVVLSTKNLFIIIVYAAGRG